MRGLVKDPVAYRYEHEDGLHCTMLLMDGLVKDFNFAARIEGRAEPFSTQMYLPMPDGRTTLANFFSPLVNNMEQMFLTGKPTYPVERTLLTTGLTALGWKASIANRRGMTRRIWRSATSRRLNPLSGGPRCRNGSRSSQRFTGISRTRSMKRTGYSWAIRATEPGTART
jgi:hypothetical protein